jgi:hypothetical protein
MQIYPEEDKDSDGDTDNYYSNNAINSSSNNDLMMDQLVWKFSRYTVDFTINNLINN